MKELIRAPKRSRQANNARGFYVVQFYLFIFVSSNKGCQMKHGNLVFHPTESFEHAFMIDLLKRLTSHILPTAFKYFSKHYGLQTFL